MIPASAATLAARAGHDVRWADGIAERWSPARFEEEVRRFAPDCILIEAKTPIIKAYWEVIRRLKAIHPAGRIALCGDHVTALPEESLNACPADFILTGGDYDFTLTELLAQLQSAGRGAADGAPGGVFYRGDGGIRSTGAFTLTRDLNTLPFIDRDLTRWELYAYENGNYRYTPGTYTMVGRDCWWGRCAFCSWTTLYTNWRTRTPESLLDEIGAILARYPVREIFDDTGCFPAGRWLRTFCEGVMARGYHKRVVLGCNMIPGVLSQDLYDLMGAANFRFVLFGLESANQATLDRINKCGKSRDIAQSMHMAKRAGLEPHVTCMVGYPWETRAQAQATIDLTRALFDKGDIDTLQATVVIPYPGTPLFAECREKGWLKTEDWDRYAMREPVMKTPMADAEIMALTRGIYRSFLTPRFLLRKARSIRSWRDLVFYARAGARVLGHLLDFRGSR
jgi:anaerobic magnesium-protoporphyrin IX monomethyl ester cyclase